MKISKFAALIKKRGYGVWMNTDEDTVFLMTSSSIYKADGLPSAETKEQAAAMLDIEEKNLKKMFFRLEHAKGQSDIRGFDLSDGVTDTEQATQEIRMSAAYGGQLCKTLICEDGELLFFDEALMAPLADVLKDAYITYAVRKHKKSDQPYIVVKNGLIALAAIMPVEVLNEDYIQDLQDFQLMCIDQFNREKLQEMKQGTEQTDGQQLDMDDLENEKADEPDAVKV